MRVPTERRAALDTHGGAVSWVVKTIAVVTVIGMLRLCAPWPMTDIAHGSIKEILTSCVIGLLALLGNTARAVTAQNPMPVEDVREEDNPLPVKEAEPKPEGD